MARGISDNSQCIVSSLKECVVNTFIMNNPILNRISKEKDKGYAPTVMNNITQKLNMYYHSSHFIVQNCFAKSVQNS